MRIPRIFLAIGAASTLSGCYVGHHGYVEPDPLSICLVGACLGWHAAEVTRVDRELPPPPPPAYETYYLGDHDNHWHGPGCGCPSRFMNGHRVFWYHGQWEFHDGRGWSVIVDGGGNPGPSW